MLCPSLESGLRARKDLEMALNAAANVAERLLGNLQVTTASAENEAHEDDGSKMLALCWLGTGKVKVQRVAKPAITEPTDAILRVIATTVCGSDLNLLHGEVVQLKSGDVLGHECVGIIESLGEDVAGFSVGQRVVAPFAIACGDCEYCRRELFTACLRTNDSKVMAKLYGHRLSGVLGYSHLVGGFAGAQAEFVRIPLAHVNLISVPDQLPLEKALFLADIGSTSYHAVVTSGAREGDIVGVWGLGPVGLLVCQWLRNVVKARRIIGIDDVPERMQLARDAFAVETISFKEAKDVAGRIHELLSREHPRSDDVEKTGNARKAATAIGLDVAIECSCARYAKNALHRVERAVGLETDTSEMLNEMIRSVKPFGTVAIIADYFGYTNHFLIGGVMEKGIKLIGCGQAPTLKYAKEVTQKMLEDKFDPTIVLTHHFSLAEVDKAYYRFDKKESGIIKAFISTKFTPAGLSLVPPLSKVEDAVPRPYKKVKAAAEH